jgi:O-antigen/teichoic acid export membrane protein
VDGLIRPGFARSVASTAVYNISGAVAAGLAGIAIARALGPAVRGEYAAVLAWFGAAVTIGQLGQTATVTYFVAHHPGQARDFLATSRGLVVGAGLLTAIAGWWAAPVLAGRAPELLWCYRLMFAACVVCFLGGSYLYALQARHLTAWNAIGLAQPLAFAVAIAALVHARRVGLVPVLGMLVTTLFGQALLAYVCCARYGLAGGRSRREHAGPVLRYGVGQLGASLPGVLVARLDQLVLSMTAPAAALGHYAVAVSVTNLALPLVSAVGNVAFPRLAARDLCPSGAARLRRVAVLASGGTGALAMLVLAGSAYWWMPLVFGPGFRASVPLVWLLAPGGALLACGQVCGDLLRGHGDPLAVARAQTAGAVATVVLLAVLLPVVGVAGAAIASSGSAAVAVVLLLRTLSRLPTTDPTVHLGGPQACTSV